MGPKKDVVWSCGKKAAKKEGIALLEYPKHLGASLHLVSSCPWSRQKPDQWPEYPTTGNDETIMPIYIIKKAAPDDKDWFDKKILKIRKTG